MSRLEKKGKEYRDALIAKNAKINPSKPYDISHTSAKSDGDNNGKNPDGSKIDIDTRKSLLAKNKFSKNKEYNHSNA
jgi:hypothetical protein